MSERVFICANCKNLFELESAVSNCRVCNDAYCEDCMDEKGLCVPCGKIDEMQFVKEKVAF